MARCKYKIWNTNICSYLSEECCFTKRYLENSTDKEADENCPYFSKNSSDLNEKN